MATTLNSSGVQFPDGTTQTTAAGVPTTAQVLSATAAANTGDVGSYAWLGSTGTTSINPGSTYAGSGLRYAGLSKVSSWSLGASSNSAAGGSSTPAGTWRAMGYGYGAVAACTNYYGATLCLRIS